MKIYSNSFRDGKAIPSDFAFCAMDTTHQVALSNNRNPHLAWDNVPVGTKSFTVICHDPDVPSRADDVNREDRELPVTLPRITLYHWVLLDIPASTRQIETGHHSDKVTPRGKSGPAAPDGMRHGINGYTPWFAYDENMKGDYYGYDGPCPPWNDLLIHRYVFTVYALDVPRLEVAGELDGPNMQTALAGHVLAEASITGTYSLNPRLRARPFGGPAA
jgi:Raf kinase inhibitor-like YbhB/YbcL family protein